MLRLGIIFILLSFIPWLALPAVPCLGDAPGAQAKWVGLLNLMGELLFWPGVALAGKDFWEAARVQGWKRILPELVKRLRDGG